MPAEVVGKWGWITLPAQLAEASGADVSVKRPYPNKVGSPVMAD